MKRIKHILACAALALVLPSSGSAYDVKPMVVELRPSGSGSSTSMTVSNTHAVPIAIEVSVHKREQLPDGTDRLVLETNDVIINPPQMVIQPGASQTIRVQWVGDPNPDHELAYRIIPEQLPIRLSQVQRNDKTAELTMKYRYEAALYIAPRGVRPSARLERAEVVNQGGTPMLQVTIVSDGTSRAILSAPRLRLAGSNGDMTIEGEDLAPLQGLNILPGATRVVSFPAPAGMSVGPVTASLESEYYTTS